MVLFEFPTISTANFKIENKNKNKQNKTKIKSNQNKNQIKPKQKPKPKKKIKQSAWGLYFVRVCDVCLFVIRTFLWWGLPFNSGYWVVAMFALKW